jgi:hypothetical protein
MNEVGQNRWVEVAVQLALEHYLPKWAAFRRNLPAPPKKRGMSLPGLVAIARLLGG